jgi:YggT family protein
MFGGGLGGFGSVNDFGDAIAILLQLLWLAILIRALLSWFSPNPSNPLVQALDAITEPILQPLRQVIPRIGMLDVSPLIALLLLGFLAQLVRDSGF